MQRLCHLYSRPALMCAALFFAFGARAEDEAPANRYPTQALVEFVNVCIATHGDTLSSLYQCSCVIDRIAATLNYDDYVEASTYAKYSALPGEGGGIFRDSDRARQLAKSYRELETNAYRACGLEKKQ